MIKRIPAHIKHYIMTACTAWTGTVSFLFTIWPDLTKYRWWILGGIFLVIFVIFACWMLRHKSVTIRNDNYTVSVEYGDLLEMDSCKVVIPFDECFTTTVGSNPQDVNPSSVCGKFLNKHPELNRAVMEKLISDVGLKPSRKSSKFAGTICYESGKVVQYEDRFLLMAFAKLDKDGRGELTFEEYCQSLAVLWDEIDKYYGQIDVCIPVLGTGVARIGDGNISRQEFLDILISSYITSRRKIKPDAHLRIICRREDDINIDKIMFG